MLFEPSSAMPVGAVIADDEICRVGLTVPFALLKNTSIVAVGWSIT